MLHASLLLGLAGLILGFGASGESSAPPSDGPRPTAGESPAEESRAPSAVPCSGNLGRSGVEPIGAGPARLAAVRCLDLPRGQDYRLPPIVSPDAKSVAFWSDGQVAPLDVVTFGGGPGFRRANRVTFRDFGTGIQDERQGALAWRSDGSGLWSVEQQVARPSGWALSGLTPILIDRDGNVRRFVPPEHPAGPLDALAWVGGEGLAIAQFGARGARYRPEHEDPSPTLAMIDVPRRLILHTLTAADAEALRLGAGSYYSFGLLEVSAVRLRNGRLRALLQLERMADPSHKPAASAGPSQGRFLPATWLVWTQGGKPAPLTPPFDGRFARAELTPDGSHILAWRPLAPEQGTIYECYHCPPRPPPTPVEGPVAALVDATSGRKVWSLKARAGEHWNRFGGPVISPTGRLALIPIPATGGRQTIALLAMADGRVLQRFSLACTSCYPQSFGFTRGGRQMWIGIMNRLVFYDLDESKAASAAGRAGRD